MRASFSMPLLPPPACGTVASQTRFSFEETNGVQSSSCSGCPLRRFCLPCHLINQDFPYFEKLVCTRRRIKRYQILYRAGDPFQSLYAIHKGSFKTYAVTEDGREQVIGFQMAAEMIGMDGIETNAHSLYVVALEESEVCIIPYAHFEQLACQRPVLQRQILKIMSRVMSHDRYMLLLLGSMHAEERIAIFLLNLSARFAKLGYAANKFQLRMKRDEIGSYLGLTIETVSRVFSRFQQKKLINVHQKQVQIIDVSGLQRIAGYCV
jgi:CRP/FNR family transcriptional regulator, anaerobic regulatory protein